MDWSPGQISSTANRGNHGNGLNLRARCRNTLSTDGKSAPPKIIRRCSVLGSGPRCLVPAFDGFGDKGFGMFDHANGF
jgi:hypothetical protein